MIDLRLQYLGHSSRQRWLIFRFWRMLLGHFVGWASWVDPAISFFYLQRSGDGECPLVQLKMTQVFGKIKFRRAAGLSFLGCGL